MAGDHGLSNIRFAGYTNDGLARQVEGLRNGAGAETLYNAVAALVRLANGLADTDQTLRRQLQEIGVTWEGDASAGGTEATENASIYAEDAAEPVTDSAMGVDSQGATFASTRNGAPDAGTLRGPSQENFGDRVAGLFGHTTDHARQVQATGAARDQAIEGLTGYQRSSSDALGRSQALPVPPGMNLVARPVEMPAGTTSVAGFESGGGGLNPSGSPAGPTAGTTGLPGGGGGGSTNIPLTNTQPPVGTPGTPGYQVGVGQPNLGTPVTTGGAGPLPPIRTPVNPLLMAEAATMMGAGGSSGAGSGAVGDRVVKGAAKGTTGKGITLGSVPDDEARAARNAERFGARSGRPGSSILQPAAPGARSDDEEDENHVRRYGVDSGDVFDDDRVVAPESIGDEPDDD